MLLEQVLTKSLHNGAAIPVRGTLEILLLCFSTSASVASLHFRCFYSLEDCNNSVCSSDDWIGTGAILGVGRRALAVVYGLVRVLRMLALRFSGGHSAFGFRLSSDPALSDRL